jgi:hypothetical protein
MSGCCHFSWCLSVFQQLYFAILTGCDVRVHNPVDRPGAGCNTFRFSLESHRIAKRFGDDERLGDVTSQTAQTE